MSLRSQLIFAMILCVFLTVLLAVGGTAILSAYYEQQFAQTLSPAAKVVNAQIETYQIPTDMAAVREVFALSRNLEKDAAAINNTAILIIAVTAIMLGSLIAIFFATRISRPLEAVSEAARRVAAGNLGARAMVSRGTAGETIRLVDDFNLMAASLERFERQSVESSAAIAHELRTPLAILRGRLQGMLDGIFKREGRDIELLIGQVDSLTQIVNDLSVVSLANAGRLGMKREPIDLASEIGALLALVEPDLSAAGMNVSRDLRACRVRADPNRIRQATLALLQNARVHASGGRSIHVETFVEKRTAIIRVSDRGPGLPAGDPALLFEPFWRSDTSRNRAGGGSGLGLSVVASIVEAHGGTVHALPRSGGGAVFEMRLPS